MVNCDDVDIVVSAIPQTSGNTTFWTGSAEVAGVRDGRRISGILDFGRTLWSTRQQAERCARDGADAWLRRESTRFALRSHREYAGALAAFLGITAGAWQL